MTTRNLGSADAINQDSCNAVNGNCAPDILRRLPLGDFLRGQTYQIRRHEDPATVGAYGVTATEVIDLPDTGRVASIVRATSRAGTSTGELVNDGYTGTAPGAGHIGISPDGNLMFAPSADVTNVDVYYLPERGEVVELTLPVATNAATLPASVTDAGVVLLLEAEALEGGVTGTKRIQLPSGSAATALMARFDLAKDSVKFAGADAVTRCRVKLLIAVDRDSDEPVDLNAFLDQLAQYV